jgi:hypothetical protein
MVALHKQPGTRNLGRELTEQDQQSEVECLPAEDEDVSVENDDIIMHAVKTRQQTAKEMVEQGHASIEPRTISLSGSKSVG